jgi:hypothetical protein
MPSSAPNMHTCYELESALRSKRTYASPPHRAQLRLGSETSTHGRVLREPGRQAAGTAAGASSAQLVALHQPAGKPRNGRILLARGRPNALGGIRQRTS